MSKFEEAMVKYKSYMDGAGLKYDAAKLEAVAKGLGPSIYLKDASLVSCSDKAETDRLKANYVIKKLGMEDSPKVDAAIAAVCAKMKDSNQKHRAVFYYLLRNELGM
ncbi:MAG: DUF2853 family protein [Saprospiraceae bacterium]